MESDRVEAIEACRTCGIFYMTSSNYLKHLFQSPVEQPDMMLIRLELSQWKIEITENDGLPQHICSTCIHQFHKWFKFRAACLETQDQFKYFCNLREENRANIKIKTEKPDPDEDKPLCDFIYVDDLSDNEYDGATPFNIPHVPIKQELIEAATIPIDETVQAVNVVESASNVNSNKNIVLKLPLDGTSQNACVSVNTAAVTKNSTDNVECKLCQQVSCNKDEHRQHLQKAHEVKDIECHICGKVFKNSTSDRLKFHMKWHTLSKHVKCTLCGFVCNSKDILKEHKRANHKRINCKICGKGVLPRKMKSHVRNHEILSNFQCEYCTEVFATEEERENHIWQLHADEDNRFPTDTSQPVNPDEEEEEDIMCQESVIDLLQYKFLCAHCDERFIEQVDLESHVNERHRLQTHVFHNKPALDTPVRQDTDENEEYKEKTGNEIDNHETNKIDVFSVYDKDDGNDEIITEHKQRLNESDFIRNSLIREQQNSQFVEVHTAHTTQATCNRTNEEENDNENSEELHHDSDNSSISYEQSYSDTELEEISSDIRPFACAKCAETFSSLEQLREHHEQHLAISYDHQQNPNTPSKSKFKCNLCEKLFDLKFSLNRHVKKHKHAPI